jgi:hypothetical protein
MVPWPRKDASENFSRRFLKFVDKQAADDFALYFRVGFAGKRVVKRFFASMPFTFRPICL